MGKDVAGKAQKIRSTATVTLAARAGAGPQCKGRARHYPASDQAHALTESKNPVKLLTSQSLIICQIHLGTGISRP